MLTGMDEFTSEGSQFYFIFFNNLEVIQFLSQADVMVQVSNMDQVPVNVTVSSASEISQIEFLLDMSYLFDLSIDIRLRNSEMMDVGVHIISMEGARLSVTAFSSEFTSSDTYRLLPPVYLPSTYEYYAISVAIDNTVVFDRDGEQIPTTPQGNSVMAIVGSESNTQVTITPTQNVIISGVVTQAGSPMNITLDEKKVLFLSSVNDLTGTHVVSNKPVSVFSGHECGNMPSDVSFCDHMIEQIPPTSTWGTEFFTISYKTQPFDRYRVLSSRPNNTITWNCTDLTESIIISDERVLPTPGSVIEFQIPHNKMCRFTSFLPVLLVQFSVGAWFC